MLRSCDHLSVEALTLSDVRLRSSPPRSPRSRLLSSKSSEKKPGALSASEGSKSPLGRRSTSKLNIPSPSLCASRSLPSSPSLLRHHTTSESQALVREFFGEGNSGSGVPQVTSSATQGVSTSTSPRHSHPVRRHRQTVTSSPLLRRYNSCAQSATAEVNPPSTTSDFFSQTLLSKQNVELQDACQTPPTQHSWPDVAESPCRLPIHTNSGTTDAPQTTKSIGSSPGQKVQDPTRSHLIPEWRKRGTCNSSVSSYFRVLVLGDEGVGKSALVRQVTSKRRTERRNADLNGQNPTEEEEEEEAQEEEGVVVQVHAQDKLHTVEIFDSPLNANIDALRPDAFIVMYSVSDRKSYLTAKEVTRHLRCELGIDRVIVLVANKTDLRRQQRVPAEEAMSTAKEHDCLFMEISATLRLNIDSLLLKLLELMTQQLLPPEVTRPRHAHGSSKPTSRSGKVHQFLSRLFRQVILRQSHSCAELYLKRSVPATVADL